MRFVYNDDHLLFLRENYLKLPIEALVSAFNEAFGLNKTRTQIKSTLTNHKIRCGRKGGHIKGVSRLFTHSQVEFITEKYQLHSPAKVAQLLNRTCNGSFTENQIKSFVHNHQINCPRTGRFDKGNEPWNTGTKGLMKANKTSFKKGTTPLNIRPVGSERITKDGYRAIKVAEPNKWELLQRHVWYTAHGSDNRPDNLRFIDGNKLNCELSNLQPVTNSEHIRLTQLGYSNVCDEIKPVLLNIVKIDDKVSKLKQTRNQ